MENRTKKERHYGGLTFEEYLDYFTFYVGNFLFYEQLTDEVIGASMVRLMCFREILERFDDNCLNSFKLFSRATTPIH